MTRDALRSALELMQQSARVMRAFTPGGFLCDWQELDNKVESFRLFQYADRELKLSADHASAQQFLARVPAGDPFHSIWVYEGAAHMAALASSLSTEGLLTTGEAGNLPESTMVALHAGMGTAFAERLLEGLSSHPSAADVERTVGRYVDICTANCRPGWEDASLEPLGLVVRCLYPHLKSAVSTAADTIRPGMRSLFWHGVGRGSYFLPANFLPYTGARRNMIVAAMAETNHFEDRRNVLAGLVWAIALVNLRYPQAIRSTAAVCSELKLHDEFVNGLTSALISWGHMAPSDTEYIEVYTRPRHESGSDGLFWSHWIMTPARHAIDQLLPGLIRRNHVPLLFSYRTPEELRHLSADLHESAA